MIERKPLVINYRPGQGYWVLAILLSIFVSTLLAGKLWGGKTYHREMADKMQLEVKAADLELDLSDANLQLSRIKLSAEVDAIGLENARREMIGLQRQIYRRDEELKLYQELLQDNDQPNGLSSGDLKLVAMEDGRVRYRWVARQKSAKMKVLSVYSDIWVLGTRDGQSVILALNTLDDQIKTLPVKLEFKYFSINQGILELPEGFEPEQIRITLKYSWMDTVQSDRKFDWKLEE